MSGWCFSYAHCIDEENREFEGGSNLSKEVAQLQSDPGLLDRPLTSSNKLTTQQVIWERICVLGHLDTGNREVRKIHEVPACQDFLQDVRRITNNQINMKRGISKQELYG